MAYVGWHMWGGIFGVAYLGWHIRVKQHGSFCRPMLVDLFPVALCTLQHLPRIRDFFSGTSQPFLRWIWVVEGDLRGMVFIQSNYLASIRLKF